MLIRILAPALALAIIGTPMAVEAKPGGCLKYGAAGAVGGHVAGRHGVVGAIAGCAYGIHKRREYKREMRMQRDPASPPAVPQTRTQTY
ncbi:MAG: hypothetical protein NVSMB26_28460 [Beijerinckiaceae bacterium]